MRLSFLLPIIFLLRNATGVIADKTILTPDFVQVVQNVVDSENIPGLTIAIVRENGPTELGAWGIKSEDGAKMTTDVRRTLGVHRERRWNTGSLLDII
jgi:hypothetical protein